MFYEYAVDPCLLADPNAARALSERFGWPKGRLIAEYPRRWVRLAYEAVERSSELQVEKHRRKRRLELLSRHLIRRSGTSWDAGRAWLDQALAEHGRASFRAIVTATGEADSAPKIGWDPDDPDAGPWAVPGGVTSRTPEALADAVNLLAKCATRLLLVDPHFTPSETRFTSTVKAILAALARPPDRGAAPAVEIHTLLGSPRELRDLDTSVRHERAMTYLGNCRHLLSPIVPADLQLSVTVWAERPNGQPFHNRYVLTEHGGIGLGTGLDAGRDGSDETDDLYRLTTEQHARRWAELTSGVGQYDLVAGPARIEGTAAPLHSSP